MKKGDIFDLYVNGFVNNTRDLFCSVFTVNGKVDTEISFVCRGNKYLSVEALAHLVAMVGVVQLKLKKKGVRDIIILIFVLKIIQYLKNDKKQDEEKWLKMLREIYQKSFPIV